MKFARFAPLAALLISAAVALPAFAGDDTATTAMNGAKTRAEVKAELLQARADGEYGVNPNSPAYPERFATGGYTVPRVQINTTHSAGQSDASLNRAATEN